MEPDATVINAQIARLLPDLAMQLIKAFMLLERGDESMWQLNEGPAEDGAWVQVFLGLGEVESEESRNQASSPYSVDFEYYVSVHAAEPTEGFNDFQREVMLGLGFGPGNFDWEWIISLHDSFRPPTADVLANATGLSLAALGGAYGLDLSNVSWRGTRTWNHVKHELSDKHVGVSLG